tara:strand:- start:69 stop:422 length:354 start_codon:yes stop_codon:yes gene_type:complete
MLGIGTDIVKTKRIKKLLENKGNLFLKKIFTSKEIKYCNANTNSYIHFSGKYAAKEAIKKALLSGGFVKTISLKKIEILNNDDKSPFISINSLKNIKINISISHEKKYAIAFALIEK